MATQTNRNSLDQTWSSLSSTTATDDVARELFMRIGSVLEGHPELVDLSSLVHRLHPQPTRRVRKPGSVTIPVVKTEEELAAEQKRRDEAHELFEEYGRRIAERGAKAHEQYRLRKEEELPQRAASRQRCLDRDIAERLRRLEVELEGSDSLIFVSPTARLLEQMVVEEEAARASAKKERKATRAKAQLLSRFCPTPLSTR